MYSVCAFTFFLFAKTKKSFFFVVIFCLNTLKMFGYSRPDSIPNFENTNITRGPGTLCNIDDFKRKHEVSLCPCYDSNSTVQDISCMNF